MVIKNGYVQLGHETNVLFEITVIPSEIQSLSAKNSTFSGISRNQSALIVAKNGFEKEQFLLNNKNQHTVELLAENNQFKLVEKTIVDYFIFSNGVYLIGITMSLMLALMLLMWTGNRRRLMLQ